MANRGRKELPDHAKRKHPITCRLTDEELETCNAAKGALTAGEWMRIGALGTLPVLIPALNRDAWKELSHAAANLNQLAKRVNQNEALEAKAIASVLAEFRNSLLGVQR